jgi:hypothetical protein
MFKTIISFGGRRFIMVMGCDMVCTVLVWFAKIDPTTYRDILAFTIGVYVAGNTYQKVKAEASPP